MRLILLFLSVFLVDCVFDITNFGAVPNSDTISDQFLNQRAILSAISAANTSSGERIVRIPKHKFYSMPIRV
jgi:hypothetical protein